MLDVGKELDKKLGIKLKSDHQVSHEYLDFRKAYIPKRMTVYEKMCKFSEKILPLKPSPVSLEKLKESIDICHLDVTPIGATSFAIFYPLLVMIFGGALGFIIPNLFNKGDTPITFFVGFMVFTGVVLIYPFMRIPYLFSENWRLRASNEMVLSVFYVVAYMRHTPNLENAIDFASRRLNPPLALDFKKILWNVESGLYSNVNESMDDYLETWKEYNPEFIESFHLIQGSLFEPNESRRLTLLDKSLDVMLTETYDKMLHYAHNLNSPITMLHMLGIILPILGLVILPLVVTFMEGVRWYHFSAIYNVFLPISIFFLARSILSKRPTGYGQTDISNNPEIKKFKQVRLQFGNLIIKLNPLVIAVFVGVLFFMIGILPIVYRLITPESVLLNEPAIIADVLQFWGYRLARDGSQIIGPFGLGSTVLSLFVVMSFGLGIGLYYRLKSKNVIEIRNNTVKLEQEFASALFQLGNRIGDGLPLEIAFAKVAASMQGTLSGDFMSKVSQNISRRGMSVENAIFDKNLGALVYFPSPIIESSMKVLTESAKKGPKIAANALINISTYIKEIHRVNERLKDLLGDVVASMNAQLKFLTPAITAIVIGITSMITTILGSLTKLLAAQNDSLGGGSDMGAGGTEIFDLFQDGIPTYAFQVIVGLYVVQLIYILTLIVNGIQNGDDKMNLDYLLGQNFFSGTLLYCLISGTVIIMFNLLASVIMRTLI